MSKLIEEPTSLPAHHIYQGGSAPGVQCANCSAGATSGSWRRGWELEDKNNANLCNRCGQRWVKLGKALAKNGFAQAAAIVDPRPRHAGPPPRLPRPSSGGSGPPTTLHTGTKRPFSLFNSSNISSQHVGQRRASTATMRSRLRSETTSENSEGPGGLSVNDDSPPLVPSHSPEIAGLAVGSTPNKYLSTSTENNINGTTIQGQYPSQNYAPKYCLQKMSEGRTTYALFWVLGSRAAGGNGSPILAVVGIDARSSGHFSYTNLPGICPPSSTPLRCTSRADVISWLIATMGVDPREKPVPESHARLPSLTIPDLLSMLGEDDTHVAAMTPAATVGGGYTPTLPGQFPLAETPFLSPVVVARSSPTKLDRGAKIKPGANGQPAFVLNINANSTAAGAGATAGPINLLNGMHSTSSLPRFRCGACGRDDHATDDCFLNCTSPPPLIHNPGATDIHPSFDALLLPGENGGLGGHSTNNNNNILGLDDLLFGNGDDDSPMEQTTAFDAFLDFSFGPGGALVSPGEPSPGTVTQPVVTKTAAGASIPSIPPPPPPHVSAADFSQKQQQQQQQQQQKNGNLKDGLEDTIRDWAVTLSGNISEAIPFSQGGGRWVPLGEALAILHHLSMLDLSLEILEKTQISRAVALLRNHSNLSVASAAHALAARWHQYAVTALQNANTPHHLSNTNRALVK